LETWGLQLSLLLGRLLLASSRLDWRLSTLEGDNLLEVRPVQSPFEAGIAQQGDQAMAKRCFVAGVVTNTGAEGLDGVALLNTNDTCRDIGDESSLAEDTADLGISSGSQGGKDDNGFEHHFFLEEKGLGTKIEGYKKVLLSECRVGLILHVAVLRFDVPCWYGLKNIGAEGVDLVLGFAGQGCCG